MVEAAAGPLSDAAGLARRCHSREERARIQGETIVMTELSEDQLFAELRKIDTPTITNVVATYPKNPLCLGLYNPWTENWYTDTSIRCMPASKI